MKATQISVNYETKSSAGDKYETSRAMGQLQKDMLSIQLASNLKILESLSNVDPLCLNSSVENGSLIKCENISLYISAGLGKISFNGEVVIFISSAAPIFSALSYKKTGDSIFLNKENHTIIDIF
ncbi:MAG: hypothetical protein ABIR19_00320 [Ginsengibacter sp.]